MFSKFQARKCSFVFGKNGTSSSLIIVLLDSLLREKKKKALEFLWMEFHLWILPCQKCNNAKNAQVGTLHVKLQHQNTFLQFCHGFISPSSPILHFLCLSPSSQGVSMELSFRDLRNHFLIVQQTPICLVNSSQDCWKALHQGSSVENINREFLLPFALKP